MQRVVSVEEMRWCDETAIKRYGVPGLLLMENAGGGVARFLDERFGPLLNKHILIVCGKGNNGGDGFVAARHCSQKGGVVTVLLVGTSGLKGDAKTNFDILKRYAKVEKNRIKILRFSRNTLKRLKPDLIIDAIFGTGFSGNVKKPADEVIRWINSHGVPVVSVDIPSGVNGTTGIAESVAIRANATVTFGLVKTGLLCNRGRELSGELIPIDIGIPVSVSDSEKLKTFIVSSADVRAALPGRSIHANKYTAGKVFVLAGSKGYAGAATMTTQAALRAGAGAVVLGAPDVLYPILAKKLTESIVSPLPSTSEGTLSLAAYEKVSERLIWADVAVIGPGLSQQAETRELVLRILREFRGKLLVDADGLNAIAHKGLAVLKSSKADVILTPHAGELSRLNGMTAKEIEGNRIECARSFAVGNHATLVLKGAPTATVTADGSVILNSTGNPGMATVGAGDVLSGIIGSIWAQGMKAGEAAFCGVYLHGMAGDCARDKYGERSLVANDLIDFLPTAFQSVDTSGRR